MNVKDANIDNLSSAPTDDDGSNNDAISLRTNSTKEHGSVKSASSPSKSSVISKDKQQNASEEAKANQSASNTLEQHLVVAKMNWANAELKVDLLKEEVKQLRKTLKVLELDLVKTKQNLGEAMNAVYEYERK